MGLGAAVCAESLISLRPCVVDLTASHGMQQVWLWFWMVLVLVYVVDLFFIFML